MPFPRAKTHNKSFATAALAVLRVISAQKDRYQHETPDHLQTARQNQSMKLNPYLNFPGNCAAAFQFYEQHLGGKITMTITFADSPLADEVPSEWRGKILHTRMMVGDVVLMGGDELPEDYIAPQGFNVTLNVEQTARAERIFAALSESGTVTVPLQETFWAARYGMLMDQFGIPWMINCERAA
jgi:PhnB protein